MIALIVAYAKNRVIGDRGCIPWKIQGDTYFPKFNEEDFIKEINERFERDISYTYVTYTRRI